MATYDNIYLTFIERMKLRAVRWKKTVSEQFIGKHKEIFLENGLIKPHITHTVMSDGTIVRDSSHPITYSATDRAKRYFLYRRERFFEGKFPVIIAGIALIKSFEHEILAILKIIFEHLPLM